MKPALPTGLPWRRIKHFYLNSSHVIFATFRKQNARTIQTWEKVFSISKHISIIGLAFNTWVRNLQKCLEYVWQKQENKVKKCSGKSIHCSGNFASGQPYVPIVRSSTNCVIGAECSLSLSLPPSHTHTHTHTHAHILYLHNISAIQGNKLEAYFLLSSWNVIMGNIHTGSHCMFSTGACDALCSITCTFWQGKWDAKYLLNQKLKGFRHTAGKQSTSVKMSTYISKVCSSESFQNENVWQWNVSLFHMPTVYPSTQAHWVRRNSNTNWSSHFIQWQ